MRSTPTNQLPYVAIAVPVGADSDRPTFARGYGSNRTVALQRLGAALAAFCSGSKAAGTIFPPLVITVTRNVFTPPGPSVAESCSDPSLHGQALCACPITG